MLAAPGQALAVPSGTSSFFCLGMAVRRGRKGHGIKEKTGVVEQHVTELNLAQ